MSLVKFLPGNGTEHWCEVDYISDFAKNVKGCAFCEGDPCAEEEIAPQRIKDYMHGSAWKPEACPFCKGRAS